MPSNYPSIADLSGLSGTVTKVRFTLTNVTHTFPADFDVLLVGPQGQRPILMSDAGGAGPGVTGRTYIFDQSAGIDFPTNTNAPGGIYKPVTAPAQLRSNLTESTFFPRLVPARQTTARRISTSSREQTRTESGNSSR